jgi:PII-like signaling protein
MTGHALRLTVFIGDDHRWNHKPLHHEIVTRARDAGLAGATVLHGHEGFGASSLVHTDRLLDIADSLPIVIVIVDTEDRVRGFLPQLDEVIGEGLVVLDKVEILRHNGQQTS